MTVPGGRVPSVGETGGRRWLPLEGCVLVQKDVGGWRRFGAPGHDGVLDLLASVEPFRGYPPHGTPSLPVVATVPQGVVGVRQTVDDRGTTAQPGGWIGTYRTRTTHCRVASPGSSRPVGDSSTLW